MDQLSDRVPQKRVDRLAEVHEEIRRTVEQYVVGNRELIDLISIGILSGGHVLIDGVPGTAKTTISKIVAHLVGYEFRRVQGAVDTQPADIIGVRIYDADSKTFILQKGPIFSNFVMIDEINRLTPKTQSAFIEAMAERQTTIDGQTYPLADPYFVIATQNTQEFEGTFPLIEAQRDRFMYSMTLNHLERANEQEILRRAQGGELDWTVYENRIRPIVSTEEIRELSTACEDVYVDEEVLRYILDIVVASRDHDDVRLGTSTRGSLALLAGSKVRAAIEGRNYVIPDDVKRMAFPVLGHRLILAREAEISRVSVRQVVNEILEKVEVA